MKINSLLLLSFLFLFACGKDDDTSPEDSSNIPVGTFSAKIDGELMDSPTSASAVLSVLDTSILNTALFQLNGADVYTSGLFKNMIILFSAETLDLSEDTYTWNGACNATALCPQLIYAQTGNSQDDSDTFTNGTNAAEGNLTITFTDLDFQVGGHAKGTFSGRLYEEDNQTYREVTEGKFNLDIL